jgi:hypothetical protein
MNRRSGVKIFLSFITAPIVLAQLIYILIRHWRCDGLVLLAKIRSASPIRRDIAYKLSWSKRKWK